MQKVLKRSARFLVIRLRLKPNNSQKCIDKSEWQNWEFRKVQNISNKLQSAMKITATKAEELFQNVTANI